MAQPTPKERALRDGICEELRTVRLGQRLDLDRVSESLCALLKGDRALIYAARLAGERFELDFLNGCGGPKEGMARGVEAMLRSRALANQPKEVANSDKETTVAVAYDPLRPANWQRNRAVALQALQRREKFDQAAFARLCRETAGIGESDQVRVLVCEGASLLSWVGCFRPMVTPFNAHEVTLLQSLTPALLERLAFEARLRRGNLAEAALDRALNVFEGPALVVDGSGAAVFANRDAEGLLNREARDTRSRVKEALAGRDTHYRRFSVDGPGMAKHHLLLARARDEDAGARTVNASRDWDLTPRERQVLEQVVRGLANAAIGRELGCAERTVELHMTHLMEKARVDSRAELVARFWSLR